mgnify:CR=1 FL=1
MNIDLKQLGADLSAQFEGLQGRHPGLWPLAPRLLDARVRRGKEDEARVDERLGIATVARPPGDLVWLHGASVGELNSARPVVAALAAVRPVVVSANSDTGLAVARGWGTGKIEARPDQDLRRPLSSALHMAIDRGCWWS